VMTSSRWRPAGQLVQSEPGGHATSSVVRSNGTPPPLLSADEPPVERVSRARPSATAASRHRGHRGLVNVGNRSSRAPTVDARRARQYLRRSTIGPDPGGILGQVFQAAGVSMQPRAAASGSEQSPSSDADLRRPDA
jgi:hypothetical protein